MTFKTVDVGFGSLERPEDYVRLAVKAEEHGFDCVWLQEGTWWGPIPLAAMILGATRRLKVGTGVVSPFRRHPEVLAADAAVLSQASGGRFILGLGSAAEALRAFGVSVPQIAGMREATEIVRRLLRGERFTYQGRVFQYRDPRPFTAPLDHRPPVVIGAMGPKMVRLGC